MSDQVDALRAAHWAAEKAEKIEANGNGGSAESYWEEAERQYIAAGLDPEWMDSDGPPDEGSEMETFWLFPADRVEITSLGEDSDLCGIVAQVDDLTPIEQ